MLSKPFGISNGTCQGCPLSPIIFALLMEPLASTIRTDQRVSGISCNGIDHKISLVTDDIILVISNPNQSLQAIQEILHQFSSVSFYKLNACKSLILPMNISEQEELLLKQKIPYTWVTQAIPYLETKLSPNPHQLYDLNYRDLQKRLP